MLKEKPHSLAIVYVIIVINKIIILVDWLAKKQCETFAKQKIKLLNGWVQKLTFQWREKDINIWKCDMILVELKIR